MARRRPALVHGLLIIDKPVGCTSHDVVDRVRRVLSERRVGHSGTLDPDASGVLVVGVGQATRLLRFVDVVGIGETSTTSKRYTGTVVLGSQTDTLDASGTVTATFDMSDTIASLTAERVRAVVEEHLLGDIDQVPPMVSALRVDGRRLHELAREGIEIERESRRVTIHSFEVVEIRGNEIDIDVTCSSGTYVRSLAADLGRLLGGGGHLRDLRRTAVGPFTLDDATPLSDFESLDESSARERLLPVLETCRSLTKVHVDAERRSQIAVGKVLPRSMFLGSPPWAVVAPGADGHDELIAVYEPFANAKVGDDMARPIVVLVTPGQ